MSTRAFTATLIAQLVTGTGAVIGILSWDDPPSDALRVALGTAAVLLTGGAVVLEMLTFRDNRPRGFRSTERINRFMREWISQRGKVTIFSNDMSWVSERVHETWLEKLRARFRDSGTASIHDVLLDKASRNELTLCLPQATALSTELQRSGASVATYDHLGIVPTARFTIVRDGQADAEVAIGHRSGGLHRIETYANGQHPAFALAEDLVRLVTALQGDRSTS